MFSSNASQVSTAANYIEDVFSTYLYTGTGASQTITNGIDLSTKGGMVWLKSRSAVGDHYLFDTSRGTTNFLGSNTTNQQLTGSTTLTAFNNNGFTLGAATATNGSGTTYTSWTFRKQAKFFDVVTYTGNDATLNISHNLGSVPGCIIVKTVNANSQWQVWHRGLSSGNYIRLNTTAAQSSAGAQTLFGNNSTTVNPTSTQFTVGSAICAAGQTYVAYLFAHDAGGFGASGSDNVISCGSFTTSASGYSSINLGWEPQWVLIKTTGLAQNWFVFDNMRGFPVTGNSPSLSPNLSNAEDTTVVDAIRPTATGFDINADYFGGNRAYIYIAIRRGPMKTPTSGTSVFSPLTSSGATGTTLTTNFPVDMQWLRTRDTADAFNVIDRMRGISTTPISASTKTLFTTSTSGEGNYLSSYGWNNTGFGVPTQQSGQSTIYESFRRAPGFFDVVCYTGTGSAITLNHNLGVTPELIINKNRSGTDDWYTTTASLTNPDTYVLTLNSSNAQGNTGVNFIYNRTASTFSVFSGLSNPGQNYVNYLFATVAGVSKVGSYTGTAALQTINCGFTGGARFVLIKRTDSTGDWYVWDSARGISSGNDPYLLLNSTAAEVTGTNYVDTTSVGFQVTAAAPAGINASGGSYIFLAVS